MEREALYPVINYLKDQLLHKKKPKQRAIRNSYNYWKAMYEFTKEELTEDKALRLLNEAADEIRGNSLRSKSWTK